MNIQKQAELALAAVKQRYSPNDDQIFSFIHTWGMSGSYYSEQVAVLHKSEPEKETICIADPKRIEDYHQPLAVIALIESGPMAIPSSSENLSGEVKEIFDIIQKAIKEN